MKEKIHYNRWFTDKIQKYIESLDVSIKNLFQPYKAFYKMDNLFGLSKGYIKNQRNEKGIKTKI